MNSTAFYHCLISKLSVPQFLTHTFIFKLKISIAIFSKFLGSTKNHHSEYFLEKLNFQLSSTLHYSNVMNITLESADFKLVMSTCVILIQKV